MLDQTLQLIPNLLPLRLPTSNHFPPQVQILPHLDLRRKVYLRRDLLPIHQLWVEHEPQQGKVQGRGKSTDDGATFGVLKGVAVGAVVLVVLAEVFGFEGFGKGFAEDAAALLVALFALGVLGVLNAIHQVSTGVTY